MSFKSPNLNSKMVLKLLFFVVLDLESPKDRGMHPTRSKAWEQSNPGFLTILRKCVHVNYDHKSFSSET